MENKFYRGTERPWRLLQQLIPHQQSNSIYVYQKPLTSSQSQFYGLILPLAAICASVVVLLTIIFIMCFFKRKKSVVSDVDGPSIVIYPYQQGATPQFFLPLMRHSSSFDIISDEESEPLLLARTSQQRLNSLGFVDPSLYGPLNEEESRYPEGHLGRVWFSLRYEPLTEKLLIHLDKAKNLPSGTVGSSNACDPLVRLTLLPDERRCQQTKLKRKTCQPLFDENFVFQIPTKDLSDHSLKLAMIDASKKRRSMIGQVLLPLSDFAENPEEKMFKLDLERDLSKVSLIDFGELLVSLTFYDHLDRLKVAVMEARKLKSEGLDCYVKVTLSHKRRPVKVKRTATIRGTDQPNFSESFNFKLTPDLAETNRLENFYWARKCLFAEKQAIIGRRSLQSQKRRFNSGTA